MRYNSQISLESENVVDPNVDKNPLIENAGDENPGVDPTPSITEPEDVSLDTSPEIDGCKDTVETNPTVREIDKAIDNDFKEADNKIEAVEALATISAEMRSVMDHNGKLTAGEIFIVDSALKTLGEPALPISLESITTDGMIYTGSHVALETLSQTINRALTSVNLFMEGIVRSITAAAKTITPIIDRKISEATKVKASLDNSNREAGLKEVSGSFVSALVIDGAAPNGKTVVNTANYLGKCAAEALSPRLVVEVEKSIKPVFTSIAEIMNADWEGTYKPSRLVQSLMALTGLILLVKGMPLTSVVFSGGSLILGELTREATLRNLRLDTSMMVNLVGLCPSIAKIEHNQGASGPVTAKRSLPLFGGKALVVAQYDDKIGGVKSKSAARTVPGIGLVNIGELSSAGKTMQALTGGEQLEAINATIANLNLVRDFYKGYPERAAGYMRTMKAANSNLSGIERVMTGGVNAWAAMVYRNALMQYSRTYLEEVIGNQNKIAKYVISSSTAVVGLVAASSAGAKANVAGSVSQEDANPFL